MKRSVNFFDVLLILVIIAVVVWVVALVVRDDKVDDMSDVASTVSYKLSVTDIPAGIGANILVGQRVYDAETGALLGEITDVRIEPHIIKGVDMDSGDEVASTIASREDVIVTVQGTVRYDGVAYNVDGRTVAVGEDICFRTLTVMITGRCISMTIQ